MGATAYNRGSALTSRHIRGDLKPSDPQPFVEDHALRREIARLERRLSRGAIAIRAVRAMLTLERSSSASMVDAIGAVYAQARDLGAGNDVLYWLTLARCRAESAREWK